MHAFLLGAKGTFNRAAAVLSVAGLWLLLPTGLAFRFWCNDDNDGLPNSEREDPGTSFRDYEDGVIQTARDLEDFARIWVRFDAFQKEIIDRTYQIGLKWKNTPEGPSINIYKSTDTDGSDSYLKEDDAALNQISGKDAERIGPVTGTTAVILPNTGWDGSSGQNATLRLLFEGSHEGKGELVLSIQKSDGTPIGEGPGVWLELKNIKGLYERAKATPESIDYPYDTTGPVDAPSEPVMRWPTLEGTVGTYNDSEYRAWKCGESLKQYVTSLPSDYTKNLAAHSMGNIVSGSALQKGMLVVNYALLNAAVPAMCYDTSRTHYQSGPLWKSPTPDDDSDVRTRAFGYGGQLQSVSGNLINFFLPRDFATTTLWEANNFIFKPQKLAAIPVPPFATGYYYDPSASPGQRIGINYVTAVGRFVTTAHEAMAYAVHSHTRTIGTQSRIDGAIDAEVDMDDYNFDTVHSAEFNFRAQQTTAFYNRLMTSFQLLPNP